MGNRKASHYVALGIAVLFLILGLLSLPQALGWLLVGLSICSFSVFGYALISARSRASKKVTKIRSEPPLEAKEKLRSKDKPKKKKAEQPKKKKAEKPVFQAKEQAKAQPKKQPKELPEKKPKEQPKKKPSKKPASKTTKPLHKKKEPVLPQDRTVTLSKKYDRLMRPYPGQNERDAFAHFHYDRARGESWEARFEDLAALARPEPWNFQQPQFKKVNESFPILLKYLDYTFLRLQDQNKIQFQTIDGKPYVFFNTGLQTPFNKDIFATFKANTRAADDNDFPDWFFRKWRDQDAKKLAQFAPLPKHASYIQNQSDLTFDASYDISVNVAHVVRDNRDRLPLELQGNETLAITALTGAINQLKTKCERNDAEAVPFWFHTNQKMQLLLPLRITDSEKADAALVADKDTDSKIYRVRTILPLDVAYSNARLLRKPTQKWLNP